MLRRAIDIFELSRVAAGALAILLLSALPLSAAEEGKAAAEAPADGPAYYKLSPIVLPVFDGDRVTRQVSLVLTLQLAKGKTTAELQPVERKLYDAFITELYTFYDQHTDEDRVLDPPAIKEHLQNVSNRVLGEGVVEEVLIQQAFERVRNQRPRP